MLSDALAKYEESKNGVIKKSFSKIVVVFVEERIIYDIEHSKIY